MVLTDASVKYILFRDIRLTISLPVTKFIVNMNYVRYALFTLPNFVHVMKFYPKQKATDACRHLRNAINTRLLLLGRLSNLQFYGEIGSARGRNKK